MSIVGIYVRFAFYGERKVACGDIRLLDTCQRLAQFALVERCDALYAEAPAREAVDGLSREEEVAVAADGRHAVGATMKRWLIDPFCTIILPSSQPVPFPYHPVLWQGQSPCAYQP